MKGQKSIKQIKETCTPQQIYQLINRRTCEYTATTQTAYQCEDKAYLSLLYLTGARNTELVGGWKRRTEGTIKDKDKKIIQHGIEVRQPEDYTGIQRENISFNNRIIEVTHLPVIKRREDTVQKYGELVTQRPKLIFPLDKTYFKNPYFQQYLPFSWLIKEYLAKFAPKRGRLFRYKSSRAWRVCSTITGEHPHYFRSQMERYHVNYIEKNVIKHAKYMRRLDINSMANYVDYTYDGEFADDVQTMDFKWIDTEVDKIKRRLTP
ncbi:MAG: hypothetical protein LBH74_09930 [Nitrososphaerota archaeon]|nr:hypothetical protein [Nitrososphaerota archaeon]